MGERWFQALKNELELPYIRELKDRVRWAYTSGPVHPSPSSVFNAYLLTPPDKVKVVIIGQDPYPNDHAHGLAFSSKRSVTPPSLRIILRELDRTMFKTTNKEEFLSKVSTNNLSCWGEQGVMLLNSVLTVGSEPGSHNDFGWQKLTSRTIELLWEDETPKVFVLWGKYASEVFTSIDGTNVSRNHLVLTSGHPATALHGKDMFSGNNHFPKINKFLEEHGRGPINWEVHGSNTGS